MTQHPHIAEQSRDTADPSANGGADAASPAGDDRATPQADAAAPASPDASAATRPIAIHLEGVTHRYPAVRRRRRNRKAGHGSTAEASPAATSDPNRPALDNVSFDIHQGEVFGILGPNGSGKTTLFRILATLLRPQQGVVQVHGQSALDAPNAVRQHLGVVFQMPSVDDKLKGVENLTHQGHLYGLSGNDLKQRLATALDDVNLTDVADQRVETYSGGMRRRLEVAKAMLHDPTLLLLDEPSTGLDPVARLDLWERLLRLRDERGCTIAVSTHLMDEAEQCDRLAVLESGKLIALDSPSGLKARIGGDVVTIECPASATEQQVEQLRERVSETFSSWFTQHQPRRDGRRLTLAVADGPSRVAPLAEALPGHLVQAIRVGPPTLDDVFLHLTGRRIGSH